MGALLAAILLVPFQAQSEADKLEAALKKFGDRKYQMFVEGKKSGTLFLKTRFEVEHGRKMAVFEDSVGELKDEDKAREGAMTLRVALDGFRLISVKGASASGKDELEIINRDGVATIKSGGEEKTISVTPATIAYMSMFRILCVQEQKVGSVYKADVLDARHLEKGHEFRCVSKETIEIDGAKHEAFKWRQTWEGKVKILDNELPCKVDNSYWVSPDGYLLRFAADADDRKEVSVMELAR